jgi:2-oxoglutarate decarboxylase
MAVETTIQVVMPQMGDSVTEGTVLEWHKAEGDTVTADETIVEISTDKVDAEVAAPATGTVIKIHAAEGDTVTVGALLAEIAPTNGTPAPDAVPAPGEPQSDTPSTVKTIDIVTPSAGESVTEGTILEWTVKVGDSVAPATRSSRSQPTRSTSSCRRPPPARSPSCSSARATPSPSAR